MGSYQIRGGTYAGKITKTPQPHVEKGKNYRSFIIEALSTKRVQM